MVSHSHHHLPPMAHSLPRQRSKISTTHRLPLLILPTLTALYQLLHYRQSDAGAIVPALSSVSYCFYWCLSVVECLCLLVQRLRMQLSRLRLLLLLKPGSLPLLEPMPLLPLWRQGIPTLILVRWPSLTP